MKFMKKKILFVILFFVFGLIPMHSISADEYSCVYYYSDDYKLTLNIDSSAEKINLLLEEINCTLCWKYQSTNVADFWIIDDQSIIEETKKNIYSNTCDSTIMIFRYWSDGAQQHYFHVLFNDTLEAEAIETMKYHFGGGTYVDLTYSWLQFSPDESTKPAYDIVYKCKRYENFYTQLEELYNNYQNCTTNCNYYSSEYNRVLDQLSQYCVVQLEHLDYGKSCLNKCLNLDKDLKNIRISQNQVGECGFSGRLILFIANIIRWLKYIIPVAVIILGILDFIKAIGADKEDEMKKAQGRFIKRLIAAALIFIIPFILEFILNKMGFDAIGCGIINL